VAEDVHPIKIGSLIDKVWYLPNLRRAWMLVKANHGTWGVDGQSLEAFEAHLDDELQGFQAALKDDAYVPQPGRRVYIPKPDGRRGGDERDHRHPARAAWTLAAVREIRNDARSTGAGAQQLDQRIEQDIAAREHADKTAVVAPKATGATQSSRSPSMVARQCHASAGAGQRRGIVARC
jgi:hypothetical protein